MYSHLFAKAYDALKGKGKLTQAEIEAGRFTSLDNYFAHMADLISISPNYVMIPLDDSTEGVFKINANDRTIAIPPQFAKCAAVKNDEKCEIIVFSIDRYFDYQDLDRTSICVQWINAAGEEGISLIQLKDLETFPGKLRFGWPLTSNITKKEGPVQFAVRFYTKATDEASGKSKYHYLLNTLTSTIQVKNSLDIENPVIEEENVHSLFAEFVQNSINPSYPTPAPVFFVKPGLDLPVYGAIGEGDTLTLTAQAVADDLGVINYEWMYIPADTDGTPINLETAKNDNYTINHQVWEKSTDTSRQGSQKYYVQELDESEEVLGYKLYTGAIPAEEGVELYVCKTSLTIKPANESTANDKNIVGSYYVNATNTVSVNTTTPSSSTKCVVPTPHDVEFTEKGNLPKHMFTDSETKMATLAVKLVDDPTLPEHTFQWSSKTVEGEELVNIPESNKDFYTTNTPGWYKLHVSSKLNRKVKENESELCKVTHLPTPPIVQKLSYIKFSSTMTKEERETLAAQPEQWTELLPDQEMPKYFVVGDIIRLKVETDLDDLNPLKTESLTYTWYVQEPDEKDRELTIADKDITGNGLVHEDSSLTDKVIDVRCLMNGTKFNYHCVIKNTIQTKSAETDSAKYNTFVIE